MMKIRKLLERKFYKGENIPPNRYILVVTLFIKKSYNQLLLQKRSKQKGGKIRIYKWTPKVRRNKLTSCYYRG